MIRLLSRMGSRFRYLQFDFCVFPEDKRMASGLLGMQVPGNRLRVRVPCPPLS